MADTDTDDVVEPAVLLRRSLERRRDPQIIVRRLDHLAARDAVEYVLRTVADAGIGHGDDGIVVGLEHDADIDHPGAVARPHGLPVTAAAGKKRAAQALAFEAAAGD